MNDAEIIKALECCCNTKEIFCSEKCPLYNHENDCFSVMKHDALDLINRQKAEIERLRKEIDDLEYHLDCECSTSADVSSMLIGEEKAKAEAIKDVLLTLEAEAVSSDKYIQEYDDSKEQKAYNQALWKAYNLVKEMAGETE